MGYNNIHNERIPLEHKKDVEWMVIGETKD
jgi:hypothetical protein